MNKEVKEFFNDIKALLKSRESDINDKISAMNSYRKEFPDADFANHEAHLAGSLQDVRKIGSDIFCAYEKRLESEFKDKTEEYKKESFIFTEKTYPIIEISENVYGNLHVVCFLGDDPSLMSRGVNLGEDAVHAMDIGQTVIDLMKWGKESISGQKEEMPGGTLPKDAFSSSREGEQVNIVLIDQSGGKKEYKQYADDQGRIVIEIKGI